MSTAAVSRAQQTTLPPVVHRPPAKKDFTYTFQRVAPLLFVFLLSLAIYTKYLTTKLNTNCTKIFLFLLIVARYKQSAIVVSNKQVQPFTPPTPLWEGAAPKVKIKHSVKITLVTVFISPM